jgi:hypothetical protein
VPVSESTSESPTRGALPHFVPGHKVIDPAMELPRPERCSAGVCVLIDRGVDDARSGLNDLHPKDA